MRAAKLATVSEFRSFLPPDEAGQPRPLYRGQANAAWRVDCSAVRRFDASPGPDIVADIVGHTLVGYLADLLNDASRYVGSTPELRAGCSDLDVLAQLQHHGAATGLIDFTRNPLVALWFACNQCPDEDGAVYLLNRSDTQDADEAEVRRRGVLDYFYRSRSVDWQDRPHVWTPVETGRSANQESVFVFGVPFIRPFRLKKAVVSRDAKEAILKELRDGHGITEEKLFDDLPGYAQRHSASSPFDTDRVLQFWADRAEASTDRLEKAQAHVDYGTAFSAVGRRVEAIAQYDIAIGLDPTNIGAHVNRGTERLAAGEPSAALADYNAAIQLATEAGADGPNVGGIYRSRGLARHQLGQTDLAWQDLDKARDMGLDFWYNERGERGPRLDLVPETTEDYRMLPADVEGVDGRSTE